MVRQTRTTINAAAKNALFDMKKKLGSWEKVADYVTTDEVFFSRQRISTTARTGNCLTDAREAILTAIKKFNS